MNKIKKLNKKIIASNSEFKKMTQDEKRVRIAKDVLASLKANKIIATPGSYCDVNSNNYKSLENKSFQKLLLKENEVSCEVCAIGSLFVSLVSRENDFRFKSNQLISGGTEAVLGIKDMIKKLHPLFTKKQLFLMELVFEGDDINNKFKDKTEEKAYQIYKKFNTYEERLKYIMKNVIKNKGKFIL